MFNSQKLNKDVTPWHIYDCDGFSTGDRTCTPGSVLEWEEVMYEPRPEYDNNPNPVLESFRGDTEPHAESWLASLKYEYRIATFGYQEWTVEHITHARKVLERLVNVYGTD